MLEKLEGMKDATGTHSEEKHLNLMSGLDSYSLMKDVYHNMHFDSQFNDPFKLLKKEESEYSHLVTGFLKAIISLGQNKETTKEATEQNLLFRSLLQNMPGVRDSEMRIWKNQTQTEENEFRSHKSNKIILEQKANEEYSEFDHYNDSAAVRMERSNSLYKNKRTNQKMH